MKVFLIVGWRSRLIEGNVQGYVSNLFDQAQAIVLLTKSEHKNYLTGRLYQFPIDWLHTYE